MFWGEEGRGIRFYMCMYVCVHVCMYVCVYVYITLLTIQKIQLHLVSSVNAVKKRAGLLKLFVLVFSISLSENLNLMNLMQ